jgi:hypothetical protein
VKFSVAKFHSSPAGFFESPVWLLEVSSSGCFVALIGGCTYSLIHVWWWIVPLIAEAWIVDR